MQVYLDTSDFRNFAIAQKTDASCLNARIFDRLSDLVKSGLIEVRYSAIHVLELLRFDSENKENAVHRMRLMKQLTEDKTVQPLDNIARTEIGAVCNNVTLPDGYWKGSRGFWWDEKSIAAKPIPQMTRAHVISEIEKTIDDLPIPRRERRRRLKGLVNRKGCLTEPGLAEIKKHRNRPELETFAEQNPLTDRFYSDELFDEWLLGKMSDEAFVIEALRGLLDPVNLADRYLDRGEFKKVGAFGFVYDFGATVLGEARALSDSIKGVMNTAKLDLSSASALALQSISKARVNRFGEQIYERLIAAEARVPNAPERDKCVNQPLFQGLDFAFQVYFESFAKNPLQNPKPSDGGDLLHSGYLPYVDIWRGDSRTANMLKKNAAKKFNTTIVAKLPDLIAAIESRL